MQIVSFKRLCLQIFLKAAKMATVTCQNYRGIEMGHKNWTRSFGTGLIETNPMAHA